MTLHFCQSHKLAGLHTTCTFFLRGIKISVLKTTGWDIFVGNDSGNIVDKGSNFLLQCLTCSSKMTILGIIPNKEATRDSSARIYLCRVDRKCVMCCGFSGK